MKGVTGEYIDLYGWAVFGDDKLVELDKMVLLAQQLAASQASQWKVMTGILMEKPPKEIYSEVNKQQMQILLDKLEAAITKARATNAYVTFLGD